MNAIQYAQECKRFWTPVYFGNSVMTFPIFGLVEESVELLQAAIDSDRVIGGEEELSNLVLSEAGDCLWNVAMICNFLSIPLDAVLMVRSDEVCANVRENQVEVATRIVMKSGQIAGFWRKVHRDDGGILSRERIVDIEKAIRIIMLDLSLLLGIHAVSIETVMTMNIAKYQDRHQVPALAGEA